MTVSSIVNRNGPYVGNGVTTEFAWTFKVLDADTLKVYQTVDGVETEVTTGITKNGVPGTSGNVTFDTAPASGVLITLIRESDLLQETDYAVQARVLPTQVEDDFDRAVMGVQDLNEFLGRTPRLLTSSTITNPTLPDPSSGRYIRGKTDGTGWEDGLTAAEILQQGVYEIEGEWFDTRAEAIAATVEATTNVIYVKHDGRWLAYERDATGTALTTAGSVTWSPAGFDQQKLQHWGCVSDNSADCAVQAQAALDWVELTGGTLHAPAGRYRFDDKITVRHTELVGEGWHFAHMSVTDEDDLFGTVFICNFGTGTAAEFIRLDQSGALKHILLYNNSLQADATRPASWNPTATPWAIRGGEYSKFARTVREAETHVEDVCFLEFTHGIKLTKGGERGWFMNILGNPLTEGLFCDGNYDVTRFRDIHFWPIGGNTGAWQDNEKDWTLENATAFTFGRVDGLHTTSCFCIGYSVGVHMIPCEDTAQGLDGTASGNFRFTDCYFDGCNQCVLIDGTYDAGWAHNGTFSGCNMQHWDDASGGQPQHYTTERATIDIDSKIGVIMFNTCWIQAAGNVRAGSMFEAAAAFAGRVMFNDCRFANWDEDADGSALFDNSGATGVVEVNGGQCMLDNDSILPAATFYNKNCLKGLGVIKGLVLDGGNTYEYNGLAATERHEIFTSSSGLTQQVRVAYGDVETPTDFNAGANGGVLHDMVFFAYINGDFDQAALYRVYTDFYSATHASGVHQFYCTDAAGNQSIPLAADWERVFLKRARIQITGTYADDTAAGVGGLVAGDVYKTATGELRIKL